jgi:uroporphyrinogen-III synthase
MKVIITRPSPDGEAFAAAIAAIGGDPVLSPVSAIRPLPDAVLPGGAGALAFTSANGVRAFAALSALREAPVFAVGAMTAAAARAAGFSVVATAGGDVESLAALIAASKPSTPILHLAGADRTGDLVQRLAGSGIEARRAIIYEAVPLAAMAPPAAASLAANAGDCAIAFFSPRSARLFLDQAAAANLIGALASATALCLSEAVGEAARQTLWEAVEIANDRNGAAMMALARDFIAGLKGRRASPR